MKRIDITGNRYGKLLVLGLDTTVKPMPSPYKWLCICDCGKVTKIWSTHIKRAKSCGCIKKEALGYCAKYWAGELPEYGSWLGMRTRCLNAKNPSYKNYGAKGVTICERWNLFKNFYEDMGAKPSKAHSLDRINPFGNYEPSNCRWATPREQALNQRRHYT